MIPPTLAKIGQLVFKGVFKDFKHNRNDGADPPIPEDKGFEPPSEKVHRDKKIDFVLQIMKGILWSLGVVN
jgi:hypothetical protein